MAQRPLLETYPYVATAVALVVGGLIACFVGYRLFRTVLAIFGFVVGAFIASAIAAGSETLTMVLAVLGGGLAGAALLTFAYYFGVALVGAALGAAAAHLVFTAGDGDPGVVLVVLLSIVGAVGAVYLQRYFLIIGTAFGGAWAVIVGGLALAGDPSAMSAVAGGYVWAVFPLDPVGDREWLPVAWVVLAAAGILVQLAWTAGDSGRVRRRKAA